MKLLRHRSPVVRGYLVRHVVRDFPWESRRAAPLLLDATVVITVVGCEGLPTTIAEITAEALCLSKDRRARNVVQRAQMKKRMTSAALRVVTARCHFED